MSSRELTSEQQHSYGCYLGEPTSVQLAHYFHLDDTAKTLVQKRRGDYNRLGFAIQLCTVRFLGTFLINPIDVPQGVIDYLASQLEIEDVSCLEQYLLRSNTHWEHTLIIKKHYGYRDFSEQPGYWRLVRWLYQRAWIGGESPTIMFDLTTARLVEQKILLPGVTVLSRLISAVRERVANRTWNILAKLPNSKQIENLEALIVVEKKARLTPLEQLRKSPTRRSAPSLVNALNRLVTIRALGIDRLFVGKIPPIRFKALSKTAFTLRAQAIARMPTERRIATLVAWAYVMEAIANESFAKVKDLSISICAVLIAQGCNIGLSPLVRKRIPALTRGRLSWVEQNYFRPETIIKANARLVDAQTKIPIVQSWGEIRQRYREGQEEQLGTLGLMVNVLVLWNTYYMDAAIERLLTEGWEVKEEDKARLSPLPYSHINMLGRYQFNLPEELKDGALRPLRDVDAIDELADLDFW